MVQWVLIELSADLPGKTDDKPSHWASATHMGEQDGVLGSWLPFGHLRVLITKERRAQSLADDSIVMLVRATLQLGSGF